MTSGARADVLLAAHRSRAMTLEARRVCIRSRRDRQRDSAIRRFVTGRTVCLSGVTCVIKYGVEAPKRRKSFDVGRGVTDRTDRTRITFRKLLRVA